MCYPQWYMIALWVLYTIRGQSRLVHSQSVVAVGLAAGWLGETLDMGKLQCIHDDVIKWKHFPRHWPFVWGIHRSPVNSPHKGQRRGALMYSLICTWTNNWANYPDAGDLRRRRAHCDVTVMLGTIVGIFNVVKRPLIVPLHSYCGRAIACRQGKDKMSKCLWPAWRLA